MIQIRAPDSVIGLLGQRFARFANGHSRICSANAIVIEIRSRTPTFPSSFERSPKPRVSVSSTGEITVEGTMTARYDLCARRGLVEHAYNLGDVDTMLRLVLSIALPLGGALLMHGAALNNPLFGAIALCGESGAGKSTAAAALGAACDELIVLRPENGTLHLYATPYWHGVPMCDVCQSVVCLLRGGEPAFAQQHGADAMRHLAHHVVRFVFTEPTERAILRLLGLICKTTPVLTARCPEGDAFTPYLYKMLAQPLQAAA